MVLDEEARFLALTDTVVTGDGHRLRLSELHEALRKLGPYRLRRLAKRLGLQGAVIDPFEATEQEAVFDLVRHCRAMPQLARPLVQLGLDLEATRPHFEGLLDPTEADRHVERARASGYGPAQDPVWSNRLARFFYDTREVDGQLAFFVTVHRQAIMLGAGQRLSDPTPYARCFVVVRTHDRRYFLHWPTEHPDVPAFRITEQDDVVPFYPESWDDEDVLFEEIYAGRAYEIFGVRFVLPDLEAHRPVDEPPRPQAPGPDMDRQVELLSILGADPTEIQTVRQLSRHFRRVSRKWHPLKHLQADEETQEEVARIYLRMTNAYNELKDLME